MLHSDSELRRPRLIPVDAPFRYKWFTAIILFIVFPACLLLLPSVQVHLQQLFNDNTSSNIFSLLVVFYSFFSILAILLITAALQLFLVAKKTLDYGYFPAPNTRLISETLLISGQRAKYFSFLLVLVGLSLLYAGIYVPYYFHNLLLHLLAPAG